MYILVYGKDNHFGSNPTFDHYQICAKGQTLAEIASKRTMSGDLIFCQETKEIVQDDSWLFSWEKKDPDCYAQRKISSKAVLSGREIISPELNQCPLKKW